jgi:hypothetical protein
MDEGAGFLALLLKETRAGCMATTITKKPGAVNTFEKFVGAVRMTSYEEQTVGCAAAHQDQERCVLRTSCLFKPVILKLSKTEH